MPKEECPYGAQFEGNCVHAQAACREQGWLCDACEQDRADARAVARMAMEATLFCVKEAHGPVSPPQDYVDEVHRVAVRQAANLFRLARAAVVRP